MRLLSVLLASAVVALGLALVPSGMAKSGGEHPGADKPQTANHGDCKNPGKKSDTGNTTGKHNGYDCPGASSPQGGGTDNDGDHDNNGDNPEDNDADDTSGAPSDNDSDDQGTTNSTDSDGDHDQNGPSDNDSDDHGTNGTSGTNGTNGTNGSNGSNGSPGGVINVAGLQQVAGATSRRAPVACASRRRFTIHIRQIGHYRYTSATVFLGSRKLKTVRGTRRIKSGITLTGLPKGTFHVKITVHTSSGKTLRNVRTYHTCVPRRKHTVPKL